MVSFTPASLIEDAAFITEAALLFSGNLDIVGIYDDNGQVFAQARPLKASLRETSKIMEHPAETGVTLADHHIINPVEIDIPLIISAQFYGPMYQQIKTAFLAPTLLTVKTPVNVYQNMIIADMPHEEDPEHYDAISMALRLRQVLYFVPGAPQALPTNYNPADPQDQNTVQSGVQQSSPTLPISSSALQNLIIQAF
jgi:hypothetical protein